MRRTMGPALWSFSSLSPSVAARTVRLRRTVGPALWSFMSLMVLAAARGAVVVPTPCGTRPRACVVAVPDGALVEEVGAPGGGSPSSPRRLRVTHGATVALHEAPPECGGGGGGLLPLRDDPGCLHPPCTCDALPCNNWMDNAGSMDTERIVGGMRATYLTPATPLNATAQTLFFFLGAENTDGRPRHGQPPPSGRSILQPVLTFDPSGWCADSSTGWCFSSWNCCPANLSTHSPYIQDVRPGDLFLSSFNLSADGATFETVGVSQRTGERTSLKSPRQGRNYNWADLTQEVYNVEACDQFAASPMEFRDVKLWDTHGSTMAPVWTMTAGKPCGGSITHDAQGTFTITHADTDAGTLMAPPDPVGQPPGTWTPFAPLTDEFAGDALDTAKWTPTSPGWAGRQPGLFSPANVEVSGGSLKLHARAARRNNSWPAGYDNFTTSAVHSVARTAHGYFEVRSRSGNSSVSSSFWFHQNDPGAWTEIDVFESMGSDVAAQRVPANHMNSSLMCSHTHIFKLPATEPADLPAKCGCVLQQGICSVGQCVRMPFRFDDANFHVFGLLWNQTHVRYFADGLPVGAAMPAGCFQQAIGIDFDRETMPTWMGLPGADFDRDRPFEIDYVRAWKTR